MLSRIPLYIFIFISAVASVVGSLVSLVMAFLIIFMIGLPMNSYADNLISVTLFTLGLIMPLVYLIMARRRGKNKASIVLPSAFSRTQSPNSALSTKSNEDAADDDRKSNGYASGSFRMVDWNMTISAPIVIVALSIAPFFIFDKGPLPILICTPLVLLACILLFLGMKGYVFSPFEDTLGYPFNRNLFRRQVRLSQIEDANCEIVKTQHSDGGLGSFSTFGGERPQTVKRWTSVSYQVHLFGTFGARRLSFRDRYKRDQFISLLRRYAPHVRISRR